MYPLKLEGILKDKVWGGDDLRYYHKSSETTQLGEVWELACHPNGSSIILNGELEGKSLCSLLQPEHHSLLGQAYDLFPIMVKFLDAKTDLSVQVHPDDSYAKTHFSSLGKTEVWYILSAEPEAEIILGTNGCTLDETMEAISEGDLRKCLNHIKVKSGEFYVIPAGTIHGIGGGIVLLEIQESSDLTFRLYDYGRDREIQLDEAKQVVNLQTDYGQCRGYTQVQDNSEVTNFIENDYFEVKRVKIREQFTEAVDGRFQLISCIGGSGILSYEGLYEKIQTGDQFLIPANMIDYTLSGMLDVIITKPGLIKQ